jgi:glycosyltransferase involved in cell wall biosynthesis
MGSSGQDLLVVADSLDGGLGQAASAHARYFAARGWRVTLAAPAGRSGPAGTVQVISLAVPETAFDAVAMFRAARQLRRAVDGVRPRVVHAHGLRSQLLLNLVGVRPFVTVHGGGRIPGQGHLGSTARATARQLAPLLAKRAYSVAPFGRRWSVLPTASPLLGELGRAPVELRADVPTFLWVGRLDVPKRPEIFVRAVAAVAAGQPVRGVVLGDGPMRERLQGLVDELAAPVRLLGARDDVPAHLATAWAVCLFSDFEGVPFAVQEAMWAGRAVVLSPLPTLRWFAGTAARYASGVDQAAEVLSALTDPATAAAAGESAARRVRSLLTPESPFPSLEAAYRGCGRHDG